MLLPENKCDLLRFQPHEISLEKHPLSQVTPMNRGRERSPESLVREILRPQFS